MISYVNGRYVNHAEAAVHIEDRGYQFSDGIYEVIAVFNGKMVDGEPHLKRLERSLTHLHIPLPMPLESMKCIIRELLRRNRRNEGYVYIQISRGVAKRNHAFPKQVEPSLVITLSVAKHPSYKERYQGVSVITLPDIRWGRRDIKTVSLLPNVLAKQKAVEAGVKEAWQVNAQGCVTEGASTNSYIVTRDGVVITHPANETILEGITRTTVLALAREHGIKVEERPFTLEEAKAAAEAFLTSTTGGVLPIIQIDDSKIADGKPGKVSLKLMNLYDDYIREVCGMCPYADEVTA